MGTLATQFRQALSNVEPGNDADHAQDAHTRVSDTLTADQRLPNLGANPVLIGSMRAMSPRSGRGGGDAAPEVAAVGCGGCS